jgi:hypothetical protein
MNRPHLDTMHVPEGEKQLTDAVLEAPSPGRLFFSQLAMVVLLAAGIYAMLRGAQQYPETVDEVRLLQSHLMQADASLTNAAGGESVADWAVSIRAWRDKTSERYGVVRLHLFGCYGLLLLFPAALVCAAAVWWRGQFPRPGARFSLDGVQIAMNASVLVLLAGLRVFDSATLSVMGKTPPVQDLQAYLKTPTKEQKTQQLASLRDKLQQTLRELNVPDKQKGAATIRANAARTLGPLVWDGDFVATLSTADKEAFRASLRDAVKKSYADDEVCPVVIRAVGALGDTDGAAALETEREKSRAAWVDVKKPAGLRFLHQAAMTGRDADVRKLIERGINVNVYTPGEGHTPLHEAVARGQLKVAEVLLEKGAKLDIAGKYAGAGVEREYPLHRAAAAGHAKLVKLLLDKGADPMCVDFRGMTALHAAASAGDTESADLLMKKKAKVNQLDFLKRTPLDVALASQTETQAKMRELLVQRGGLTSADLSSRPGAASASVSPNAR